MARPESFAARGTLTPLEVSAWKAALSWTGAILIALLFLVSGLWKLSDVQQAAMRMAQARVPQSLSIAAALGFGIAETVGAVLILVPRFRRWGALATGLLLVAFMIFIGVNYNALRGAECSCFPWVKRAVGPGFFIGDGIMLALAVCAGIWSRRPAGLRGAFLVLGAVVVFAGVSYGVTEVRQTGTKAPDSVQVDGRAYSLQQGKILVFFFNPACMHCFDAAKMMSTLPWGDTRVLAVPVEQPQYAAQFLKDTGLNAAFTAEFDKLAAAFSYKAYPFGVALDRGREKAALTQFEGDEPAATLKRLGFVR
jgi:uncharacterized membrane protein YphA (DoxX/SURF4 family)